MILPDAMYLAKIRSKCIYFDEASKEKFTSKVKGKYKLCGLIKEDLITEAIGLYRFFVGTSQKQACVGRCTIEITKNDYEDVDMNGRYSSSLLNGVGYYDINKLDVLTKDELLIKLKSCSFPYVAEVSYKKFGELIDITFGLRGHHELRQSKNARHIVEALIRESDEVDAILLKIGL